MNKTFFPLLACIFASCLSRTNANQEFRSVFIPADTVSLPETSSPFSTDSLETEKKHRKKKQAVHKEESIPNESNAPKETLKEVLEEQRQNLKDELQDTGESLKESFSEAKENIGNWFNENIKANTVGDFAEIQRQNNQDFSLIIGQSWKAFPLQTETAPSFIESPFLNMKTKTDPSDTLAPSLIRTGEILDNIEPIPSPVPETYYEGAGTEAVSRLIAKQYLSFKFYGHDIRIYYVSSLRSTSLGKGKEKNVMKFWQHLSQEDFNSVLFQLYQYKEEMGLNDLLYYQLVRSFADQLFSKGKNGENLGFTVFILNQTGYDARLARLEKEKEKEMLILLPLYEKAFDLPFITIGQNNYYLIDTKLNKRDMDAKVYCYTKAFATATHPISLRFDPEETRIRPLYSQFEGYVYNEKIAEIEMGFPATDFRLCAQAPFSQLMSKTLQYRFKPRLDSLIQDIQDANLRHTLSEKEKQENKILFLLDFINRNFTAQAKQSARMNGKNLYPDLMFHKKGAGDIRDRSILFCLIANRILKIPAILLVYPDYVVPAVAFDPDPIPGNPLFEKADRIAFEGKTYFLCGKRPKSIESGQQPAVYRW